MATETFVRPNGKIYRPRKPGLFIEEYQDAEECTCIAVFGTHDIAEATLHAFNVLVSNELSPDRAHPAWWRKVPFDPNHAGWDWTFMDDAERGRPCVVFEYQ